MRIASFAICLLASSSALAQAPTQTPASPLRRDRAGRCLGHHLQQRSRAGAGQAHAQSAGRAQQAGIPRRLGHDPARDGHALRRRTTIVEQNFDYDLLSPASLIEKAVGRDDHIAAHQSARRRDRDASRCWRTMAAWCSSRQQDRGAARQPAGAGDLRQAARICARGLRCRSAGSGRSGPRSATLVLSERPGSAGSADYVACSMRSAGKIDVQGWMTLRNTSGTSFVNANTLLVAGSPGEDDGGAQPIRAARTVNQHPRQCPRHRDRQSRAARRFLCLSDARAARRSPTSRPSRSASST
jgi:hypothetical protein